jgi:diguanylate cyclase (GGDEF)-like protein/PAS domain S-box-containing protein
MTRERERELLGGRVEEVDPPSRSSSEAETRFRLAFENNVSGMVIVDTEDRILHVNSAFCKILWSNTEELLGKQISSFTYAEDRQVTEEAHLRMLSGDLDQTTYQKRYVRKDGAIIWVEVSNGLVRGDNNEPLYLVASIKDITTEHNLHEQLDYQAHHDPLTGLANRALIEELLTSLAETTSVKDNKRVAVLIVDLDDFKDVNDTFGHRTGDSVIEAIAERLKSVKRPQDTLGRLEGDEFVYIATDICSVDEAEKLADEVLSAFQDPFNVEEESFRQSASIGVVVSNCDEGVSIDLIKSADTAMYEAKRLGKARWSLFTPQLAEEALDRNRIHHELWQAYSTGRLQMYYQPIVSLATRDIVGFEALMRWHSDKRGWVPPDLFIQVAERDKLILLLGSFALEESLKELSEWVQKNTHRPAPYVSVNLSARQFHSKELAHSIQSALDNSGINPQNLVLEITETAALSDLESTSRTLASLSDLGCTVALDDFGTGYSSLSYLAKLHPNVIKIDRSFVSSLSTGSENEILLDCLGSLGHRLKMTVLAEGIETESELDILLELGYDLGQGYLFSPAVPSTEAARILESPPWK